MTSRLQGEPVVAARRRDPARKSQILGAAANLFAQRGFHAVSMEEIGAEVGITASAIYRHFESKPAVLVAMFDGAIDRLLSEGQLVAAESGADPGASLARLVDGQIAFVVDDRDVAQVYFREIANLPAADRRDLRRKQRLYLEEWVHLLTELRPGLGDLTARTLVHCAIGAIQSTLQHVAGLPDDALRAILRQVAGGVLTGAPRSDRRTR